MILRKRLRWSLLALTLLPGCVAGSKQATRPKGNDDPAVSADGKPEKSIGDDSDLGNGKKMLHNNRLRGTWSSEAADIEKSLGVGG